jgi:(1->4)-alpha-D-glucan 1-alpha-D-glucosylmutase
MAPAPDEELLLYQSLLGIWPYPAAVAGDELAALQGRVRDYLRKAMRETKLRSSWLSPNVEWEDTVLAYAEAVVADEDYRRDLARWLDRIAPLGAWTALSQLVLRLASPGIPDTYQGSELWNLTLVDPDNRERVDFARRERALAELERRWPGDGSLLSELLRSWADGRVKLFALWRGLELVRRHAALHPRSAYLPLVVTGEHAASVCAFARRAGDSWVLAVVPRWLAHRVEGSRPPIGEAVWADTTLRLPPDAPARWSVVFGGEELVADDDSLRLADLLRSFPVALVESLAAADESPDAR